MQPHSILFSHSIVTLCAPGDGSTAQEAVGAMGDRANLRALNPPPIHSRGNGNHCSTQQILFLPSWFWVQHSYECMISDTLRRWTLQHTLIQPCSVPRIQSGRAVMSGVQPPPYQPPPAGGYGAGYDYTQQEYGQPGYGTPEVPPAAARIRPARRLRHTVHTTAGSVPITINFLFCGHVLTRITD